MTNTALTGLLLASTTWKMFWKPEVPVVAVFKAWTAEVPGVTVPFAVIVPRANVMEFGVIAVITLIPGHPVPVTLTTLTDWPTRKLWFVVKVIVAVPAPAPLSTAPFAATKNR